MANRPISFEDAKRTYVHRYTMEHKPAWACNTRSEKGYYAPGFRSDREWYDATLFPGEGHVSKRSEHCCTSGHTWPLGQWLNEPFTANRHYPITVIGDADHKAVQAKVVANLLRRR